MGTQATSLKLPGDLKRRLEAAATAAGKTAHAFMIEALELEVSRAERYERFLEDALEAERDMLRTGSYAASDVHRYMAARAAGTRTRRPRLRKWRR